MQQKGYATDSAAAIAQYFEKAALPTQQETLGRGCRNPQRRAKPESQIALYQTAQPPRKGRWSGRGRALPHAAWSALRTVT